ncbi:uracil-DNA glycosylase [Succinimonas sp.]|uniref:uracil-DNA glycosylase n=1 Tax=Succinimonas sp. TaxID=1936151 RepID=UPI0038656E2D
MELTWHDVIGSEKSQPYFAEVMRFQKERRRAAQVFPPEREIFSAFSSTPFSQVKVVIIGQDPYHGPGQANGLCFSVNPGIPVPPSLKNIYLELREEYGPEFQIPSHGCLTSWARQGVFLLNNTLTVEQGRPKSHFGKGWEIFTDHVIARINECTEHTVFMLWGSPAQSKCRTVDTSRHLVLKAPHPSPLSAYRGFFGCGHFRACNAYLESWGRAPIDWRLPADPAV